MAPTEQQSASDRMLANIMTKLKLDPSKGMPKLVLPAYKTTIKDDAKNDAHGFGTVRKLSGKFVVKVTEAEASKPFHDEPTAMFELGYQFVEESEATEPFVIVDKKHVAKNSTHMNFGRACNIMAGRKTGNSRNSMIKHNK